MRAEIVIIIGAPRSGTNMLRDILARLNGFGTWPCDEINYIWRHGNAQFSSDEFDACMATPKVGKYIRRCFKRISRRYKLQVVVEKTCANSLRVDFVDQVVPEAKYIFIRRNGIDSIASAMKRWEARLDIPYILRKARFVPFSDLPYYSGRYFYNRIHRLFSDQGRLAFWGPKLVNMEELLEKRTLEEICAFQWKRCVDAAAESFCRMSANRWLEVSYESFVQNPDHELSRIIGFLGKRADDNLCKNLVKGVTPSSIGKGRTALGEDAIERLMPIVHDTMARYNYV